MRASKLLPSGVVVMLALVGAAPRSASADDPRVVAQALFDDAMRAMEAKSYDRACPALEEVVRLMPGKIGAMIELARCYEEDGKIATAWARYRAVADLAQNDARAAKARAKADELAARVPKLTVAVAPENASTPEFAVQRDGRALGAAELNIALPVDPGHHVFVASAAGKQRWTGTADVVAGEAPITITIPALADDPRAAPPAAPPSAPEVAAAPTQAPRPSTPPPREDSQARPQMPAWAWATAGAGVAALGVAAGFGAYGLASKLKLDSLCNGQLSPCAGQDAKTLDPLNAHKNVGLGVFLGAGLAGVAATTFGVVMLVSRAKGPASALVIAPMAGTRMGGVVVGRGF